MNPKLVFKEVYKKGTKYSMKQLLELLNNDKLEISLESTSFSHYDDNSQTLGLIVKAKFK